MNSQIDGTKQLQHEGKMSLKDRMLESQAYGEEFRAVHAGADQREAVKPLHEKPEAEKEPTSSATDQENDGATEEESGDSFTESL